jgi:ubiquitin-protein ligase
VSPRDRRLMSDLRQMEELASSGIFSFRTEGNPPDVYHLMVNEKGIALGANGKIALRGLHRFDAYLHREYPRRPPIITWLTPIFHPNILGPERNGGVCIGSWSAAESLSDLCVRLRDLVAYRSVNPDDALNREAGEWAKQHLVRAGVDLQQLVSLEVEDDFDVALAGTPR